MRDYNFFPSFPEAIRQPLRNSSKATNEEMHTKIDHHSNLKQNQFTLEVQTVAYTVKICVFKRGLWWLNIKEPRMSLYVSRPVLGFFPHAMKFI